MAEDSYIAQQSALNATGLSASPEFFGITADDKQLPMDFTVRKLTRDFDFLAGNPDEELFRDVEHALQEQKVLSREAHMSLLLTSAVHPGFSDTDSSSSAEMDPNQAPFGD